MMATMRIRWTVEAEVPDSRHNPGAATDNLNTILEMITAGNAQVVETIQLEEDAAEAGEAPEADDFPRLRIVGGTIKAEAAKAAVQEAAKALRGPADPPR